MTSPRRRSPAPTVALDADVSRILKSIGTAVRATQRRPVLVLTIGLPGSGKSTFARRLAPQIDAAVLESDALRRLLFGRPSYSIEENQRLFGALHAAARELLQTGRNVIIDATSLREADRAPVYDVAEQAGARLLQLRFRAPASEIERRLTRRGEAPEPGDNSTAGLQVYQRLAAFQEEPRRDYISIDTADTAACEAALVRVVEACRAEAGRVLGGTR